MRRERKPRETAIPLPELDSLINSLDVHFVGLTECLVSEGNRLEMAPSAAVGIHYNLFGSGTMLVEGGVSIDLVPHTLVILPPNRAFQLTVGAPDTPVRVWTVETRKRTTTKDGVRRYVAGDGDPDLVLICGFFAASYSRHTELFAGLRTPIVERFSAADQLDSRLKEALAELIAQEAGAGAMTATLLKQVIVTVMRRSLKSPSAWVDHFAMLSDASVARAFSQMAANPGAGHTVQSLASAAFLSRTGFMARFSAVMGRSPMAILRELRMRRAAQILETSGLSVGEIAREVGYTSSSSFARAFRRAYGMDPTEYRARRQSAD